MKRVSEVAIRELIREALDGKTSSVNVNPVVDPSSFKTNPTNLKQRPQNAAELQVAVKALSDDLPTDSIPKVYDKLKNAIDTTKPKNKETEMKSKQDKKTVEETIRRAVRKVLSEITPKFDTAYSGTDFGTDDDDDDGEPTEKHRKYSVMTDVEGAGFKEIADELGYSVAGAKQAVDKALLKAQWVGQMMTDNPDDLDIIVLTSMNDYINYLQKSGELTPADVQLMKDHPTICAELDGFREFLDKALRRARKGGDVVDPLEED